jgi:hypothetical protein
MSWPFDDACAPPSRLDLLAWGLRLLLGGLWRRG